MIKLLEPFLDLEEKKYVLKALEKKEISTYGSFSREFENKIGSINKAKYNLALTSGSVALYLANKICGANNDAIILAPSYTFVATINSIVHSGASPWLFDISPNNLCIDLDQIEEFLSKKTIKKNNFFYSSKTKKKILAICVVLTYSILPDLIRIKKICKKYKLKLIIDAACAFGSKYEDGALTNYADLVIYSFNGNKPITCGGGGVLSTNNKKIYEKAKLLASNGKIKKNYDYKLFGHNYKITNIHAAIGIGQLNRYKKIVDKKKKIQNTYFKKIFNKNLLFLPKLFDINYNLWINFVLAKNRMTAKKLIFLLNKKKIETYLFWKPIHLQKFAKKINREKMKYTNHIWNRIVPLPSSVDLKKNDQTKITNLLNRFKNEVQ